MRVALAEGRLLPDTGRVDEPDLAYSCVAESFRPLRTHDVRWLDVEVDFDLLKEFHESRSPVGEQYTWQDAVRWTRSGFTDAGVVEDGVLVARAARWTYSDTLWELAGVYTIPERRGAGLSRSVCSFVTEAILNADRVATCHVAPSNMGMRRVAESLGYVMTPAPPSFT